jgi:glucokinase
VDGPVRQLGLDLGGTKIKLAVLENGRCVARDETDTRSEEGPDAVLERMVALGRAAGDVDSVGVAVPGLFDDDGTALLFPNLHGAWTGRQVLAPLEDGLGRAVRLVNDGHAFTLAEASVGAGVGGSTVMCIVCGTGIGGGLAVDGALHLGPDSRAGEFGHHTVAEDGLPCACGNRGCLELYAGARAIADTAGAASFVDALHRARSGDERAAEAFRRAGELIGLAIANVVIFLCPHRVVVGGGVAAAGELLFAPLRESLEARARVAPLDRIAVVPAALGAGAGAIGAALFGAA